jgi:hypothetical protein
MEPKHKRLMDMWSKETNERASPPSPTSSSAGSAPKSVQLGKSKPGGVAVFAHCIKFQHGLCASPTCPDGKQHVLVKCKRTYPAGGKITPPTDMPDSMKNAARPPRFVAATHASPTASE